MIEIVLAVLFAAASSFGVLLWRKQKTVHQESQRLVDEWRADARARLSNREDVIEENIKVVEERLDDLGDGRSERQSLADLLNDD